MSDYEPERCVRCGHEEPNLSERRDDARVDLVQPDYSLPCPECGGKMWPGGMNNGLAYKEGPR